MGKASRRKARRRDTGELSLKEARRHAAKADRRGRLVRPTVDAYEAIGVSNEVRIAQALIARHTLRMDRISTTNPLERVQAFAPLAPISLLDKALLDLEADSSRPPGQHMGDWPDHLLWAVDSAVSATRLLLCGQFVGAATVARHQLERWTLHRAHNGKIERGQGETIADFVARAWSTDDRFHGNWTVPSGVPHIFDSVPDHLTGPDENRDHAHVTTTDGRVICPALVYCELSELLHGRLYTGALLWDSQEMLTGTHWNVDVAAAADAITSAVTLCLRQVRVAIATLAQGSGDLQLAIAMKGALDSFSTSAGDGIVRREVVDSTLRDFGLEPSTSDGERTEVPGIEQSSDGSRRPPMTPVIAMLAPLLPNEGLAPDMVDQVGSASDMFLAAFKGRPLGRLFTDDEFTTLAFAWHRGRSLSGAQRALAVEAQLLGDEFDIDSLTGRATGWTFLIEAAALTATWVSNNQSASAMGAVASGLRSASWLWLEDDDRAMAVLRVVFEQAARARAWRLKPSKAAALEQKPATRPRDWIEVAGWRRLSALSRALGEFSHVTPTPRWSGARELLARLQPAAEPDRAIFTARGSALELVTQLVAEEVLGHLDAISPLVASRLRTLFAEGGLVRPCEDGDDLESRFNHIWKERSSPLGPIEWTGPAAIDASDPFDQLPLTVAGLMARSRYAPERPSPASANPFIRTPKRQ